MGWELGRHVEGEHLPGAILLGVDVQGAVLARGASERTRVPWGMILAESILSDQGQEIGALSEKGHPLWSGDRNPEAAVAAGVRLRERARDIGHYRLPPLQNRPVILVAKSCDLCAGAAARALQTEMPESVLGLFGESGPCENLFDRVLLPEMLSR